MEKKVVPLLLMTVLLISCQMNTKENSSGDVAINAGDEKTTLVSNNDPSEETMKVAQAFMGAMGKGDMDTMISLMHDDMIWQNAGDKSLPWIGPWKGKKAILEEFLPVFGENFQTIKWVPNDGFASGDTAAFFGQMVGLLTKSNTETAEFTYALRVKVKDGKVILWNWFEDSFEVSQAYHKE
ncbi:MAG: nuclear transport factor 2 family protein [Bacteroidota bacterium]